MLHPDTEHDCVLYETGVLDADGYMVAECDACGRTVAYRYVPVADVLAAVAA